MLEKTSAHTVTQASGTSDDSEPAGFRGHLVRSKGHTQNDKADMTRMGKEQVLRVRLVVVFYFRRIWSYSDTVNPTLQRNYRLVSVMAFMAR